MLELKGIHVNKRAPCKQVNCVEIWRFLDDSSLNSSRSEQNGRQFADDIFKCIFIERNILFASDDNYNWDSG